MKSVPIATLPEVETDLRAAIAHYETWRTDGRRHVLAKYEETVGTISKNPEAFPLRYGEVRRVMLERSYYLVYFVLEVDRALIVAVLDGRRDPGVIRRLLERRRRAKPPDRR